MIALTLLEPWRLVLLVLPVGLVVFSLVDAGRKPSRRMRFSSLELFDGLAVRPSRVKQSVPLVLVVLALGAGSIAAARPAYEETDKSEKAVVVLAIDVSLSMSATDVAPSRIEVAKKSAIRFVDNAPVDTLIGVVAFDSAAQQIISATDNRDAVRRVISRLEPGTGTAIGEAIFASLDTIAAAADASGLNDAGDATVGTIILLSDGTTTTGRPDNEAAAAAQARGVKVNTIAFGTPDGTVVTPDGQTVPVPPDEQALKNIADIARGESFTATTEGALAKIYDSLGSAIVRKTVTREASGLFALAAVVLMFIAAVLSQRWYRRVL
ncbi:MAG: VWA domain-containing protein [Acidobacteria bacterium]|nr:VWA domain-containing protein [Acidobacteriota bacterium]